MRDEPIKNPSEERAPESIDIADFIARWPEIVEGLDSGTMRGVDATRDGQVVALVRRARASLHGYLQGSVRLPGVDLTKPVFEDEMHAERGRVHERFWLERDRRASSWIPAPLSTSSMERRWQTIR